MNTGLLNSLPDVAHPIEDYEKTGVSLNIAAAKNGRIYWPRRERAFCSGALEILITPP